MGSVMERKIEEPAKQAVELLAFEHVDLGYGRRRVLTDVNFVLSPGEFFGIVGPNGSGKTTILKAMLGILRPLKGQIRKEPGFRFGYVPQRQYIDEVFPLTAIDVAMMGRYPMLGIFSRPSKKDREAVLQCLEHVGIEHLADRRYREISGGQKQRTLIARALATQPRVLILDEPTNDMDIGSEHAIMELLKHLQVDHGITVVMVSHLLNVVVNYVEKLALIDDGLKMVGRTEEVLTARNLSSIYGMPVEVATYGDKRVVIVGGKSA